MEAIETQLKDLQKELENSETEIAHVQETLEEAQKKINDANKKRTELSSKIAALKKENEELAATQAAIASGRKAAEDEVNGAKKAIDDAVAQLEKKTRKGQVKAAEDAVQSVKDKVEDQKKIVDDLQQKLTTEEQAVADAQSKLSVHEKAAGDKKKTLKDLAAQIKTVQGNLATLRNSVKTAVKGGPPAEALYLIVKLKQTTKELETLLDPKNEEKLLNEHQNEKDQANSAKSDVDRHTRDRDDLKEPLKVAQRDYDLKVKGREAAIKAELEKLTKGEAQPAEEEPEPADKQEEYPDPGKKSAPGSRTTARPQSSRT